MGPKERHYPASDTNSWQPQDKQLRAFFDCFYWQTMVFTTLSTRGAEARLGPHCQKVKSCLL